VIDARLDSPQRRRRPGIVREHLQIGTEMLAQVEIMRKLQAGPAW
jgi:hypothetical protein